MDAILVRELFEYNPETGFFTWRVNCGKRGVAGEVAGTLNGQGYWYIQYNGIKYSAGRLAFLYMMGRWPIEVDHHDGKRWNNTWSNLREATRSENVANSERATGESGLRGVKRDAYNPSKWRARVSFGNIREWLGPFDSAEEAHAAYQACVSQRHGEFALHNRNTSRS